MEKRFPIRVSSRGRVTTHLFETHSQRILAVNLLGDRSVDGTIGWTERRGQADPRRGPQRPPSAIGSPTRVFHPGPELLIAPHRGRRYECSPTIALRIPSSLSLHGDRASKASSIRPSRLPPSNETVLRDATGLSRFPFGGFADLDSPVSPAVPKGYADGGSSRRLWKEQRAARPPPRA